jgi:integrase
MRLAGLWQDHGLVFPNELGSLLNPSNPRNRSFKRIKARSGVREDLRFHDLRHTCATLLLSEGINVKVVSEMLGHASITITLNTYAHVLPDMQDSAAEAMEAALGTMS